MEEEEKVEEQQREKVDEEDEKQLEQIKFMEEKGLDEEQLIFSRQFYSSNPSPFKGNTIHSNQRSKYNQTQSVHEERKEPSTASLCSVVSLNSSIRYSQPRTQQQKRIKLMIGDIKFREVSESDIEYLMADESEFKPPTF